MVGRGEEVDCVLPLGLGEAHLPQKRVQVSHQGLHQLLEPGIRGVPEGCKHGLYQLVLDLALLVVRGDGHGVVPSVVGVRVHEPLHEMGTSSAS